MDETKQPWTQGPWTVEHSETAEGTPYQHIRSGPTGVADTWNAANARLIAAAPALAEALAELVDNWSETQGSDLEFPAHDALVVKTDALVAKALSVLASAGWMWP